MQVKLISKPDKDILSSMSYAARTCYEDSEPEGNKIINIQKRIFDTGHHSILQHPYFTFFIEGIAISNVTLGLHLNAPFYTSSQRSGRFCFGMFSDPHITESCISYVLQFFPQTTDSDLKNIQRYIDKCIQLYHQNIDSATKIAEMFIRQERPKASDKYIQQNARKFAQEQLRVLIPTIFPTALTFTANLSTIVALYRSAWDKPMRHLTHSMAQEILALEPSLAYMFQRDEDLLIDSIIAKSRNYSLEYDPKLQLLSMDDLNKAVYPQPSDTHPVDTLHFAPGFMPNNVIDITTRIEISLATTGQDQRHRQIRRGPFLFTGGFYCPPIVKELDIANQLSQISEMWLTLSETVHPALFRSLAPYGAMGTYVKRGNLNAILHEQEKRLCWCTQQEIYEISRQLRNAISRHPSCTPQLLALLSPRCFQCGKCEEGTRYCGRDLTFSDLRSFFPKRKV